MKLLFSRIAAGILLLTITWGLQAQQTFIRRYNTLGGLINADRIGVVQADSNLIFLAGSKLGSAAPGQGLLFRIDGRGQLLNAREFRFLNTSGVRPQSLPGRMYRASDGNVIMNYNYYDQTAYQSGLAKLDTAGNMIWNKALSDENALPSFILPLNSDRFACIGSGRPNQTFQQESSYALSFDLDGNLINTPGARRYFSNFNTLRVTAAAEDAQGNLYAGGGFQLLGPNGIRPFFLKVSPQGQPVWAREFSVPVSSVPQHAVLLEDGSVVWGGSAGNTAWLVKTDANGDVLFSFRYGGAVSDASVSGLTVNSLNQIVACFDNGIVAAFDPAGEVLWARKYNPDNQLYVFSELRNAFDGGLLAAGFSGPAGSEQPNGYLLVKTDAEGRAEGCCVEEVVLTRLPLVTNASPQSVNTPTPGLNDLLVTLAQSTVLSGLQSVPLCPVRNFSLPDTTVCLGGTLTISLPDAPAGTVFEWQLPPDTEILEDAQPDSTQIGFNSSGLQTIILLATTPDGCDVTPFERRVLVTPTVFPVRIALTDSLICPGACTRLEITDDTLGLNYQVFAPDAIPDPLQPDVLCFVASGKFPISIELSQGACRETRDLEILVEDKLDKTPNAFTPNGDGVNDGFRPLLDCPPGGYQLRIYNRWGQQVYESMDYTAAWDGVMPDGSPAASDVYIWVLETDALVDGKKGSLTLIR